MDAIKLLGELSMGSRLKRLSEMCMKAIQEAYAHYNVDFDPYLFPAFHSIANSKTTTNTELCDILQTSQPAVTQTLNKLQEKKLIELVQDPNDKRKKMVSLSKEGRAFYLNIQPLW
ncbi:MAG: MarR family transcriptional regulator, partial [Bacteroidia bacterium]|nr:MarR family transcriptional regulator [Bacteroidia bacterium]